MRSLFLSVVVIAGAVACGAPSKEDVAKDPKAPANDAAVVTVPSTLPPLDTGGTPVRKYVLIPEDAIERSRAVSVLYALATATMVNQDNRTLGQLYAPDAVLHVPDSTLTGNVAVVRHLLSMARSKSLREFQRSSHGMRVIDDSTLADSGSYLMVLRRAPKDSVIERGRYATTVRARADVNAWMILEDRLHPGVAAHRKGAK